MNHDDHLGDELEAYALGMLEARDGAAIEAHVAACDACVRRLARAESGVASMLTLAPPQASASTGFVRKAAFPRLAVIAAIAAAFVLLAGARIVSLEGALGDDGRLVSAMIASHFGHAQFHAPDGRALDAKVVYDRDDRWYVILARDVTLRLAVASRDGEPSHDVDERFEPRGDAAILRLTPRTALARFELRDARGRLLGTVVLPRTRAP